MKKTYIVYAKRTPMGKIGGQLSDVRVDDLLAHVLKDLKSTLSFDPLLIDDVIIGCANQAGEDNRNLARMASVLADFPFEVPGTTLNRLCGSSLDAVMDAHARISSGLNDCVVVGGAESMTRAPYALSKGSQAFGRDSKLYDTTFGWRFTNPEMEKRMPLLGMGETAEEVAQEYKISRERQDEFAYLSHKKAIAAQESGAFSNEILPLTLKTKKSEITLTNDEGPRADTSPEVLAKLKPVFRSGGTVTAGNSSPMNDGASAMLIVSEEFLKKHQLAPLARITGAAVRGVHPNVMGIGPVSAVEKLSSLTGIKAQSFDAIELNEAFAAQALACIDQLKLDPTRVNANGGAIALGHPLGCSGTRILTTLVHRMQKDPNLKTGLASMCIGVGQGIAVSVERC